MNFFKLNYNIFFSAPLDLDFSMLESFTSTYKEQAPSNGGPRLPDKTEKPKEYKQAIIGRTKQVLASDPDNTGDSCGETYTDEQKELFVWYKYLFIDGSKPVSHMRAMVKLIDQELRENAPEILQQLIVKAKELT